jgi:hypothetical protein
MPANPCGFAYTNMSGCAAYAKPGGLLVAGRAETHWSQPVWKPIRAAGCKVLAYIDPVERPDVTVSALDNAFYMGSPDKVPLWPFPTPGARSNWDKTKLTDIRVSSPWSDYALNYLEGMMATKAVDGVFLDVLGSRLWGDYANWNAWPQKEKDEWTRGCVDFARRLRAARDHINPKFILVSNNVWDLKDSTLGLAGEQYVDGVCLEGHPASSAYHLNYIKRPFSGHNRTTIVISPDAVAWSQKEGVTHVCDQSRATVPTGAIYATPTPPPVPFVATPPVPVPPADIAELQRKVAQLTGELNIAKAHSAELQDELTGNLVRQTEAIELLVRVTNLLSQTGAE